MIHRLSDDDDGGSEFPLKWCCHFGSYSSNSQKIEKRPKLRIKKGYIAVAFSR